MQKIKAYIGELDNLGVDSPRELSIDMSLNSLSKVYKQFILNFNMNNMNKTFMELNGMLISAKASIGKTQVRSTAPVLAIKEGRCKKKINYHPKGKGNGKFV